MIKIEITAEDYYVADGLFEISTMIEDGNILDELYEGLETSKVISGSHYNAILTKYNGEKIEKEKC